MKGINLIQGDSLQALKGYADNHFDIAIVDPPYGYRTEQTKNINLPKSLRNVILIFSA
jgi:DNA modification methylase